MSGRGSLSTLQPEQMSNYAPTRDGGHYRAPSYLLFLDQVNLAHCAARRANEHVLNYQRWCSEYDTAQLWAKKITTIS